MTGQIPKTLTESVRRALGELETAPQDVGTVRLALRYAEEIDFDPSLLAKLGPSLLQVLEALCMSPRSRAALTGKGGRSDGPGRSKLDELRARREARQHDAAAGD